MSLNIRQNVTNGRIAIGEKITKQNQNGKNITYPTKLDYFIFTHPFDPKSGIAPKFPEMTKIMTAKYGEKPKNIEVVFVDHHYDEVFFTDYLNYPNKAGCNCHGNGQEAIRVDQQGNKIKVVCDYEHCEFRQTKTERGIINTCKPTGILTCLMPEAPISGGIWRFVTHSQMSIGKIAGALRNIFAYRQTLYMLKTNLKVVIVPLNVKGQATNIPTVEVELPFSLPEIAVGASTALGTLEEIKKQFNITDKALPNPVRLQELSVSAEVIGHDGSDSVIDAAIVEDTITEPPTPQGIIEDDEFHF